ncbi:MULTISPECIES: lasso peptide [Nostocales]|uniref:Lasso peptide n=3 Tax=Nostocales TaxID=1161 RepID=A0A0C1R508_9CYAN|nr:lasso peptide [Tolypothrix bouteillei]KAF3886912.1 lasso peptide [Tolypothrix bouteillei VB521301]
MKSRYTAPKLTVYGNVAEITQILGSSSNNDFLFFNGNVNSSAAASPDAGSSDLCIGPAPSNANCGKLE